MTTCANGGCSREIPPHKLERGARFCSATCRAADHREHGKLIPGRVQSVSRCADGCCVVVVRVPSAFYGRLERYQPGAGVEIVGGD